MIAFFTVLYHPDKNALLNIKKAMEYGFIPIVFINAINDKVSLELHSMGVCILGDNTNQGLGVAFRQAENYLKSQGINYFVYFDQDTVVSKIAWSNIKETYKMLYNNYSVGVLFYGSKSRADTELLVINSGCVFNMNILDQIGFHDDSFFVECVDYEFCLRLNIYNFRIICVKELGIDHYSLQDVKTIEAFGRKYTYRLYGKNRMRDFNKAHLKLLRKSIQSFRSKYFLLFLRSFMVFNFNEIKNLLVERVFK